MPVKLVVFDMAGTTVQDNDNVAEVLQSALQQFNYPTTINDINVVMGYPKPEAIRELLKSFPDAEINDALVQQIHSVFVEKMLNYYKNDPYIREKDGVRETFEKLKEQNIKIGIDTGFSRNITDVIIDRLGWRKDGLFDVSVASDEVENGRPFPDMVFKAMEAVGVTEAAEVAKVGDTASDLHEGTSAGCKYVIGVTTGAYTEEELKKEPHTHLISNIREVLDIVLVNTLAIV
jgi:phosphonatase-like hydrolase